MSISRRGLLAGLGAALALAATPAFAGKRRVGFGDFRDAVTKEAFEKTFGDSISPDKIKSYDNLKAALAGKGEVYQQNYINAAADFISAQDAPTARKLFNELSSNPGINSGYKAIISLDLSTYSTRGRKPSTNSDPLMYAMFKLKESGAVTADQMREMVTAAAKLTFGNGGRIGADAEFKQNLLSTLEPVVKRLEAAVTAVPDTAPEPSPFK